MPPSPLDADPASVSTPSPDDLHTTDLGGTGTPLVFCHGLFGQGRNWTAIAKQFIDRHRTHLVDLPNHGQSLWTSRVDLVADADRLVAFLRTLDEPVTLVGHSMGGKVAMLAALRHPEHVRRLVIVDVSPVNYQHTDEFAGYIDAMSSIDLGTLDRRTEADEQLTDAVPSRTVRSFLLQNLRRTDEGWQWLANLAALRTHLGVIGSWPEEWSTSWPAYTGPVLWIAGADSHYVKDEYAPAMEALFPKVRRVTVKDAGHWVHSQRPDVFVEVLKHFLDATSADG